MTQQDRIIIERSKFKGTIISTIAFCGGMLFSSMLWKAWHSLTISNGDLFFITIGLSSLIIMLFLLSITGIIRILDPRPGLIIDQFGIHDLIYNQSIEWSDIERIKIRQGYRSPERLLIIVRNPEKYINTNKNSIKRLILKVNVKVYGSPCSLDSNWLKCSTKLLKKIIENKIHNRILETT